MRELKFRAWDKVNKIYTYATLGDLICGACTESGDKKLSGSSQIWEQYTGLSDENGREIYEGDIVKFVDLELAIKPTGVVCFDNAKFFIKDLEFSDGTYHIVDFYDYNIPNRDFEVIGNIHEDSPNEKE